MSISKRKQPQKQSNAILVFVGIGAGGIFFVCLAVGALWWFLSSATPSNPSLNGANGEQNAGLKDGVAKPISKDKKQPLPTATPGFQLVGQVDPSWTKPERIESRSGVRPARPFDPSMPPIAVPVFDDYHPVGIRKQFLSMRKTRSAPAWDKQTMDAYLGEDLSSSATEEWPVNMRDSSSTFSFNLADLNAPYMIVWPDWVLAQRGQFYVYETELVPKKSLPGASKKDSEDPTDKKKPIPKGKQGKPGAPVKPPAKEPEPEPDTYMEPLKKFFEVIDLRTGKTAFKYGYRTPVGHSISLSPDAKIIVGGFDPLTELDRTQASIAAKLEAPRQPSRNSLMIMQPNQRHPSGWIEMEGNLKWMGFIAPRVFAVLEGYPKTMLKFWDLNDPAKPKLIASMRPNGSHFFDALDYEKRTNGSRFESYDNGTVPVAVSPNGRWLAVSHSEGISIVDTTTHENIGNLSSEIPGTGSQGKPAYFEIKGTQFSRDGSTLYAYTYSSLVGWQMTDGQQVLSVNVPINWNGFAEGAEPSSIVTPGATQLPGDNRMFAATIHSLISGLSTKVQSTYPLRFWKDMRLVLGVRSNAKGSVPKNNAASSGNATFFLTIERALPDVRTIPGKERLAVTFPKTLEASTMKSLSDQPQQWKSPPVRSDQDLPRKMHATCEFTEKPVLSNLHEVANLEYGPLNDHYLPIVWKRLDRQTGKPIENPMEVTPVECFWQTTNYNTMPNRNATQHISAALHPGEPKMVIGDTQFQGAFRIVDGNTGRQSLLKIDEMKECEFVFWPTADRIIFVHDEKVYGFDPTNETFVFKREGHYTPICDWAHQRSWFAIWNENQAEIIDVNTGECIAVCRSGDTEGVIVALKTQPDDKQLAGLFSVQIADGTRTENRCILWDLSNGNPSKLIFGDHDQSMAKEVEWLAPDRLCLVSASSRFETGVASVFEQSTGIKLGEIGSYSGLQVDDRSRFSSSQWLGTYTQELTKKWVPVVPQAMDNKGERGDLPKKVRVDNPRDKPVCIEVDFEGDAEASRLKAKALAQAAVAQGWQLGGGGYRIRYRYSRSESKNPEEVIMTSLSRTRFKAYSLECVVEENGKTTFDRTLDYVWDPWSSKYRTKNESVKSVDDPKTRNMPIGMRDKLVITTTEYKFDGDVGTCMFNELKESLLWPSLGTILPLPEALTLETELGTFRYPVTFDWTLEKNQP